MSESAADAAEREIAERLTWISSARLAVGNDVLPDEQLFQRPLLVEAEELGFVEQELHAAERDGALPPEEIERWRARVALVARGEVPAPTDALRAAAEAHLAELAAAAEAIGARLARAEAVGRLEGALSLFVATACLGPAEREAWRARVGELQVDPDEDEPLDDEDEPLAEGELLVRPPDALVRVLAVPLARHDAMCVTTVDVHERSTEIRWHLLRDAAPTFVEAQVIARSFALADDVGTDYGQADGGAGWGGVGAGPHPIHGTSRCEAAIPPQATELTITRGDAVWRVPLLT